MIKRLASLAFLGLVILPVEAAEFRLEFVDASNVPLDNPHDLKLSPDGKYLFVSDVGNNRYSLPPLPSIPQCEG